MHPLRPLRLAAPIAFWRPMSWRSLAVAGMLALLAACGGSDNSAGGSSGEVAIPAPAPAPAPVLEPMVNSFGIALPEGNFGGGDSGAAGADGTAGDGAAIADAPVRLVDSAGRSVTGRTDAQGYYAVRIDGFTPPFIASVTRADGTVWHSPSLAPVRVRGFITINISGLTDKLVSDVAVAVGLTRPSQLTPQQLAANAPALQLAKDNLKTQLDTQIRAAGLNPATFDPVTLPFRPDKTGVDAVLESVDVVRAPDGSTVVQPEPAIGALTITPANVSVAAGGSVAFSSNEAVTFSVAGGAANGNVVATGSSNATYTAPAAPGTYQVLATSSADPTRRASASVTVAGASGVRVSSNVRIAPGSSTQLTATLDGQPLAAAWSIAGSCTGCSITAGGLFTAGSAVESVTVRGSNPANPAQAGTTVVTVATEVLLALRPAAAQSLTAADMLSLHVDLSPNGINRGLDWTTTAGSVIGVDYFFGFVPTAATGSHTVTATSVADPSRSASVALQVTAPPATALVAPAAAPATMRYDHADAALPDGRILLVGGQADRQGGDWLRSTELFEPASRSFRAGPQLAVPRVRPEAIAIDADRVLVTGGQESWQHAYNSAEVLNLATGSTAGTANAMGARRIHHRMVRLGTGPHSGKVLVLGGFNGPVPYGDPVWLSTAGVDLFDPATSAFTPAGAGLNTSRGLFTATLLADGRVLIVGGMTATGSDSQALASAEIYDPVAGTFRFTGGLAVARFGHTATRLADGRVLVVGGEANAGARSTAEVYDPATGVFTPVASSVTVARRFHAAAAQADGRVLLFGGESGDFLVRGTVEVYDPASQAFTLFARMATARVRLTATPITAGPAAGKVLVFGGGARNLPAQAAELSP
jgi:plastocyanin